MEPGPVPPHERAWRHPSELGPPAHEPTTVGGRVLIVTSAALGLLMVGALVVAISPSRAATPTAVSSTADAPFAELVGLPGSVERGVRTPEGTGDAPPAVELGLVVTPVGDGMAVTTLDAIAAMGSALVASLPDGRRVEVVLVSTDEARGLAMVALPAGASGGELEVADEVPGPDDTVLVHGVDSTVVPVVALAALDVDEGTPVLDADGDLVGLCTDAEHGTELVPVVTGPAGDGDDTAVGATGTTAQTTVAGTETTAVDDAEDTTLATIVASTDPG